MVSKSCQIKLKSRQNHLLSTTGRVVAVQGASVGGRRILNQRRRGCPGVYEGLFLQWSRAGSRWETRSARKCSCPAVRTLCQLVLHAAAMSSYIPYMCPCIMSCMFLCAHSIRDSAKALHPRSWNRRRDRGESARASANSVTSGLNSLARGNFKYLIRIKPTHTAITQNIQNQLHTISNISSLNSRLQQ
jgi:hypothetical protein